MNDGADGDIHAVSLPPIKLVVGASTLTIQEHAAMRGGEKGGLIYLRV